VSATEELLIELGLGAIAVALVGLALLVRPGGGGAWTPRRKRLTDELLDRMDDGRVELAERDASPAQHPDEPNPTQPCLEREVEEHGKQPKT
jgi:hypothetical protein